MKSVALAYCIDNIKIAEEIERQLSRAFYTFEHFYCKRTTGDDSLSNQLRAKRGTILLIVSDNFLKSSQCMNNSLRLLQERGADILPIIVEGAEREEGSGQLVPVPTHFDRVSDIIKYINYWQDQYLDLRKQKRQVHDMDEDKFNDHLRVMRDISGEIGEFLRTLRNLPFVTYEEFADNSFESFFHFTNDDAAWRNLRELPALAPAYPNISVSEPMNVSDMPGRSMLEGLIDREETPQEIMPEPEVNEPTPVENTLEYEPEQLEVEEPPMIEYPTVEEPAPEEPEMAEAWEAPVEEMPSQNGVAYHSIETTPEVEPDEAQIQSWIEDTNDEANAGNSVEALTFVANLVEKYPTVAALRYHYALLLAHHTDNLGEAIHQLEAVLELNPTDEPGLFLLGQLAELKEDFLLAKNSYEKILDHNDQNPDAYYRLGMVTLAQFPDQTEQARKYFKKAAKYDENNFDALYRYASLLAEDKNESEKAVKNFKKVLEQHPDHPFANYDLALLYHKKGKSEHAREFYLRAVKNNPELKTPENDALFEYKIPTPPTPPITAAAIDAHIAADTIEMLKQNIAQLEGMLQQQQAFQEQQLAEQAQEPEPEPAQPRVGDGKTALITGATSGIGKATAEVLAENGFRLILTGRRKSLLEEVASYLEETHDVEVKTLQFDVRDVQAVQENLDTLEEEWQTIDILINNAGKAKGFSPIQEGSLAHWEEMIDTNIKGLLYITRAVTPHMVARGSGHIVNIGSIAGKEVYPNGNVYCATKFAVDALTRAMRLDLVNHNIRVSQVTPGHVEETEFAIVRFDGDAERAKIYEDFQPLTAHDVAEAIFYMLNCPPHVNVQDMVIMGTQQASATVVNRSGRPAYLSAEEEE